LGKPKLLVLDEPGAGLDPDQRLRLRDVLSKAGQRGTVIVSTHQTDEVAAFCQTVLVLDRGRLRFVGSPRDLAAVADGRVWIDDQAHPGALRSWVTSDNHVRSIGTPPPGAQLVEPAIDDGYLMLTTTGEAR
jgi:ABC-2 type transport system ATP-binding protein